MADKFKNKYRIPSARHPNWNYGWKGYYFITICTRHRQHFFGQVQDGQMCLSHTGVLADVFWHEIKSHTCNIELDAFVVMPNHVHGLVHIVNDLTGKEHREGTDAPAAGSSSARFAIAGSLSAEPPSIQSMNSGEYGNPANADKNVQMAAISPCAGSLGVVIRSYKSAVTKHAHRLGFDFGWQERFYDSIVRNDASLQRIRNYIANNPRNWTNDKFHGKK